MKSIWRECPSGRLGAMDLLNMADRTGDISLATAEFFEVTDFLIAENRKIGTNPFFRFTVYPNYFENGIGEDLGTFVGASFISPDRIQADTGVGSASWTSDVLMANVSDFPTSIIISWDWDYPGFIGVIEFRTAATAIGLAAGGWLPITDGDTVALNLYYQWRVSFSSYRAFAFDTLEEAEVDTSSAWALDIEDDADTYQSYAVDSIGEFGEAYIENVLLAGELRLPAQDILDGGSLSLPVSTDFSSLISGDHTMRLLNRNNQYSSRHENFIFAGENDWQRKNIKIEMGFMTLGDVETGTILLYVGNILKWGPVPLSITKDSYESGEVEIYSRDAISLLMDQKIGTPDDDGTPNPVVCGQILREATKLGDNSLDIPVKDIDYEGDILIELSTVDLSGANNLIELSTADPYEGLKCLRSYCENAGYARGWIDLPASSDNELFKTKIKFVSIPSPPIAYNMAFLRVKAGGNDLILLEVNSDYRVYLNYNGTRKETDWYVNRNQNIWSDFTIGIYGKNPGLIRISLDGNQIINYDKEGDTPLDLTSLAVIQKIGLGVNIVASEIWEIKFDNSKLYNIYYPEAYYVPGYPFADIGSVYVDGVVKVEKTKNGITQIYSGGKAVDPVDLTKIPAQGLVVFGDLANPPSGSVFLMLNKDTNTHPVDAIEAVLTAGGRNDLINIASFAAAKTARPDDSVGCYFESMSMADAVLAISQRALLNVIISGGEVKILPYGGAAPIAYDWVMDQSVCAGLSASDDSETKKNKINTKWGQYDTNSRLFYAAQDAVSIAKLGSFEEELDFSWGNEVGSDNGDMARNRAICLLNRLKGSLVLYEDLIALAWKFIRTEIGDTVQVNIPYFGPAEIFRVVGKDITMTPPYELKLSLALYPGES